MLPKVFISYRREDSASAAGRLRDRIAQIIPADNNIHGR